LVPEQPFSKHEVQAPVPDSNHLVCLESGGHCGVEACFAPASAISCQNTELLCLLPVSSSWTDALQKSISGLPLGPEAPADFQILPLLQQQCLIREQACADQTIRRLPTAVPLGVCISKNILESTHAWWMDFRPYLLIGISAESFSPSTKLNAESACPDLAGLIVLSRVSALDWRTLAAKRLGSREGDALGRARLLEARSGR
jgi:hypothetical protein